MPLSTEQKERFETFLQKNVYGKKAVDGNNYHKYYTEVQVFKELEFIEVEGAFVANITRSGCYQQFYRPKARLHNETENELVKLAETMGIQFDPKTNFHGKLFISDPSSIQILKEAGVIKEKDALDLASSSCTSSSTFFSSTDSRLLAQQARTSEETDDLQLTPEQETLLDFIHTLKSLILKICGRPVWGEWNPLSPDIIKISSTLSPRLGAPAINLIKVLGDFNSSDNSVTFTHEQCEAAVKALNLREPTADNIQIMKC